MKLLFAVALFAVSVCLLAADDTSIAGKWMFTLETEAGVRNAPTEMKLDGTAVTGKFGEVDLKGTYSEGKLELAFPFTSEEAGFSATLKLTGKLDGADMVGTWEFGQYTGTFKATRNKE